MFNQSVTFDTSELAELFRVLVQYQEISRKSWGNVITQEATQWQFGLFDAFKKISPTPASILDSAKARGFAVRRRANSITKVSDGVSAVADAAADSLLGAQKSDYFRVEMDANGVRIKPVRFSKGKRAKLIRGGRSGRRFSDSARRANKVSAETIKAAREANPDIKRLNHRALAVGIELALRSTAGKGGLMAVQWLERVKKSRKSSTVKRGPLVIRSTKGVPLGMVEFLGDGDNQSATLSGLVPGTAKQAARHSIVSKVAAARVADRLAYILPRLERAKQQAIAKAKS